MPITTSPLGKSTVSDRIYRRWYEKFETSDFDISDKSRSKPILKQDPFLTTTEIAERHNSAQETITDHIRKK